MMDQVKIRSVFQNSGVTTALLVDDAYDEVANYAYEDLERGFQLFEEREALADAFVAAGGAAPVDAADLDAQLKASPALVDTLRTADEAALPELHALARAVFQVEHLDKIGQRKPLEDLKRLLEGLGVEATAVGSAGPGAEAQKYPLIFMDYFLGEKGAPSVEKSRDRIMEIVGRYLPEEMPIVVLMSSELNKEKLALEFRDSAGLLGCQFKFVMKGEFEGDGIEFVSSLADLVQFLNQSRTIGGFVDAWKVALVTAGEQFGKDVLKLDLQDYFQIHAKMGPLAARRFGDHMSGLFDGYLRKLVEDQPTLLSASAKMNALEFDEVPPSPFSPSEMVAALSHASAFQSLPFEPAGDDAQKPALELGDVFLRDIGRGSARKTEVCVIISQACDLEHGKSGTVLLVNGVVTKRTAKKRSSAAEGRPILRIDLFQHDKEDLIIEWDAGDLSTYLVSAFGQEMARMGYAKVARLRPVQALALQQKFAAHLTRVGLPDSPPPYRYPAVEVWYQGAAGKVQLLPRPIPASKQLACVIGDEKPHAVLQETLFTQVREALAKLPEGGLDTVKLEKVRKIFSDVDQTRALRNSALLNSAAVHGLVSVIDREFAYAKGDALPKGCWLAIVLNDA